MKKLVHITLALFFLAGLSHYACGAPVNPVRTMTVPFATAPPAMDGVMEASYGPIQNTVIFNATGYEGAADFEGSFSVCWDMNYFYLFCMIVDDVNHSYEWGVGNSWEFDNVALYMQLDTNTVTTAYSATSAMLRFDRGLDSVETHGRASRADFIYYMEPEAAGGWLFETAIPWTFVLADGADPSDIMDYINEVIGFDLEIADSDNEDGDYAVGNRDIQAAWDEDDPDDPNDRTEDLAWNNTSVFGYITLEEGTMNPKPIANAGPDQYVDENTVVYLDGTASYDPEGETITYTWSAPPSITLSNIHSATPSFTAPDVTYNTSYNFGLVVNDGNSNSLTDYVRIYVNHENVAPVANAGTDQSVKEGGLVMLNGSGSYDSDGTIHGYTWTTPAEVNMVNATSANPLLVAPDVFEDETIPFILTVSDGSLISEPDTMNLYVQSLYDEYDTLVVYDTAYIVQVEPIYNTILISVTDNEGDLIARELEGILYVELYPNPADQFIHIRSEKMIYEIEILDIEGDLIQQETINALEASLNLGAYTAGNYLLRMNTEAGIITKQFVLE